MYGMPSNSNKSVIISLRQTRKIHQRIETIRRFKPDTAPQKPPLPYELAVLRQKIQSNASVKQLISGIRKNTFSNHHIPKDLMIRIKSKKDHRSLTERGGLDPKQLCVDELDTYSRVPGTSYYFPQTSHGLYAGLTDMSLQRIVKDIGWIRKDFVEHCAKILRLRVVAGVHRSGIELVRHRDVPVELDIPLAGKKSIMLVGGSRLDLIRKEVRRRIILQDSQWLSYSPFIKLGDPSNNGSWTVSDTLPPSGLQCIIKVPKPLNTPSLSVSSESDAKLVWNTLAENNNRLKFNVLDQSGASWISYVMGSAPESGKEPTISPEALEFLYHYLSNITMENLVIHDDGGKLSRKKARRLREQLVSGSQDTSQPDLSIESSSSAPELCSEGFITYNYTLNGSGSGFARPQGEETKHVPVYDATAIFGSKVSSTVINWLLSNTGSSNSRYIGVVALPCTADLAAQLNRLAVFTGK